MNKVITVLCVFHLILLTQVQFTLWPEMISSPYLLLNNFSLYTDFIHPYPPLLPILLTTFFKIFGFNILLFKIIIWSTIVFCDVLIYLITKELKLALRYQAVGLFLYIFLQTFLDGNMLWYDTALTIPLLLMIYYYVKRKWNKSVFWLICMMLIKQSAIFVYVIFAFLMLLKRKWFVLRNTFIATSIALLFIVIGLYMQGSLLDAYNWVVRYPSLFWTNFPGYVQLSVNKRELISIILFSLPSAILLFNKKYRWLGLIYFGCLVGVYPRFSFFHLQPALAVFALTLIIVLSFVKKHFSVLALILMVLVTLFSKPYLVSLWAKDTRFLSSADYGLSSQIHATIPEKSIVYMINIPSHQYYLTNTIPPKPWLDNYGWYFEVPGQQGKVITEWNKNPPEYIVWKEKEVGNWYDIGAYEPEGVALWLKSRYEPSVMLQDNIWIWTKKI